MAERIFKRNISRRDTALEFDVRNWRTIFYANATELEERLVDALTAAYSDVVAQGAAGGTA